MDLSRIKKKEKITIIQPEKYPNDPVLTLVAHEEGKRHTIKLNRQAMSLLDVNDENSRLIMFDEYNIAPDDQVDDEYDSVIGVVSDVKVKAHKQFKSFNIDQGTRRVKSKDIHNTICSLFELNEAEEHSIKIHPISHLKGVFTLEYMKETVEETVEVEVDFNKGEEIVIEQ